FRQLTANEREIVTLRPTPRRVVSPRRTAFEPGDVTDPSEPIRPASLRAISLHPFHTLQSPCAIRRDYAGRSKGSRTFLRYFQRFTRRRHALARSGHSTCFEAGTALIGTAQSLSLATARGS